ncbi:mannosyl-oligosaccharide alpha-1,2-mannosidase, partial [Marasmius crinis-equi]
MFSSYELALWRHNVEATINRFKLRLAKYAPWSYIGIVAFFVFASYVLLLPPRLAANFPPFAHPEWDGPFPGSGSPLRHTTFPFPTTPASTLIKADVEKQDAVVNMFKHAWSTYEKHAFGADEYHPLTKRGSNFSVNGGVGYCIVDAIDTMILIGEPLKAEYTRAREWIANDLSFDRNGSFSTFETTIRVLGGLLSAFYLTSDPIFRTKAIDLADRIYPVFNQSHTGAVLPARVVDLGRKEGFSSGASVAEVGTLQLEFRYGAELTVGGAQGGEGAFERDVIDEEELDERRPPPPLPPHGRRRDRRDWWYASERVIQVIKHNLPDGFGGLAPIFMDAATGQFLESEIRLGGSGDSYYEYLLKQYLQTAGTQPVFKEMYTQAMQGIHDKLVKKTKKRGLTYMAHLVPSSGVKGVTTWREGNRQEHLICFLAGSLMLGATTVHTTSSFKPVSVPPRREELTKTGWRDWNTGVGLLEG